MISHRQRLWALGITGLVSLITLVALTVTEHTDSQVFSLAVGTFTMGTAGFFDALRVEQRRTDPNRPALRDDIISENAVNAETSAPGAPR